MNKETNAAELTNKMLLEVREKLRNFQTKKQEIYENIFEGKISRLTLRHIDQGIYRCVYLCHTETSPLMESVFINKEENTLYIINAFKEFLNKKFEIQFSYVNFRLCIMHGNWYKLDFIGSISDTTIKVRKLCGAVSITFNDDVDFKKAPIIIDDPDNEVKNEKT